nr:bZIP transcription factor 17 [Cryptomonas sp.]
MNLETNNIHVEKNMFFSCGVSCLLSWKRNKKIGLGIIKNFGHQNFFRQMKNTYAIYMDRDSLEFKTFDFYSHSGNYSRYCYECESSIDLTGNEYEKNINHCIEINDKSSFSAKRRIRRKFLNEDERMIARVLKNRRTAEESRQRRIQKMKQLENFVVNSEERERKLRDEIHSLGKQNASQIVELIIIKRITQKFSS